MDYVKWSAVLGLVRLAEEVSLFGDRGAQLASRPDEAPVLMRGLGHDRGPPVVTRPPALLQRLPDRCLASDVDYGGYAHFSALGVVGVGSRLLSLSVKASLVGLAHRVNCFRSYLQIIFRDRPWHMIPTLECRSTGGYGQAECLAQA